MRDELDNTLELIDILENGGMELVSHASPPFPEDTFLLGADLIEQLKMKRKVMLTIGPILKVISQHHLNNLKSWRKTCPQKGVIC